MKSCVAAAENVAKLVAETHESIRKMGVSVNAHYVSLSLYAFIW